MPAKTVSDAFLSSDRIKKTVSLTELKAQIEQREGGLQLSSLQKISRAFNRNALVTFAKSKTIGVWRLNKMPLHGNNVKKGSFDAKTSAKTVEALGQEASLDLNRDQFVNGMALSSMLEITAPRTPIDGKGTASLVGQQLIAAFDACKDYSRPEYGISFTAHADILENAKTKKALSPRAVK